MYEDITVLIKRMVLSKNSSNPYVFNEREKTMTFHAHIMNFMLNFGNILVIIILSNIMTVSSYGPAMII